MKYLERCYLCEPQKNCDGGKEKRVISLSCYDGLVEIGKNIAECPIFRKTLKPIDAPKLINQKTGEPYESL